MVDKFNLERLKYRKFPGPFISDIPLRVAFNASPYADVIAHAKASLDKEICGVLVGSACKDDQGIFVHVEAIIEGTSTQQGSAHVTFTQETWNHIHKTLEEKHHSKQILGWYHSHPGFGVNFSDMDLFIHNNFFPSRVHIALVIDPLSGETSICCNGEEAIEHLDRYWVDGREVKCPVHSVLSKDQGDSNESHSPRLDEIETRLNQVLHALEEQRITIHRFLVFCGILVLTGIVLWIGISIYNSYTSNLKPPQTVGFAPIPVKVGDKEVLLGVGIKSWDVPPELNAILMNMEREKQQKLEELKKKSNELKPTDNKNNDNSNKEDNHE